MRLILDTCMLIGMPAGCVSWIRRVEKNLEDQFVVDLEDGPCWEEVVKHSPTPRGVQIRKLLNYNGATIPNDVYKTYLRALNRNGKLFKVTKHDGEPTGPLKKELEALVAEKGLQKWWRSDRKWISLAQNAEYADIYSTDGGFLHAHPILKPHNIEIRTGFG